jgi:hypothetical protein
MALGPVTSAPTIQNALLAARILLAFGWERARALWLMTRVGSRGWRTGWSG